MKNLFSSELLISIILFIVLIAFLSPTKLFMPTTADVMLVLLLIVTFLVFTSLFWKEKAQDERDNQHRLQAGRISFLLGTTILVIGIVFQSLEHNIDPWLVFALIFMVIGKTISRIYSQIKQ